jgi:alpha-glucosidase
MNWFIGGKCNEDGHTSNIKLDFLFQGYIYTCTIYADGKKAHYKTNPKAYTISKKKVKRGDVLNLKMAPGGGFAISLEGHEDPNVKAVGVEARDR